MKKEKYIERDGKRYKLIRKGKYSEISKPKSHKFLATKILSVFFVVFVAAPLGVTFGLFYDGTTKNLAPIEDNNITETLTKRLTRAVNEIKDNTITLNFDDQTLDSILMQVNKQYISSTPVGDYIPKFYCTIDNNKYNFYADIQSGFFKTRASISTTLKSIEDPDTKDKTLRFSVDSINLGRLGVSTGLIGNLASKFVSQDLLNNALKAAHLSANLDLSNMALSYSRSQFKQDIGYWLDTATAGFGEMNLIFDMFEYAGDKAISTDYTNGVKVALNLSDFTKAAGEGGITIPKDAISGVNLKDTVGKVNELLEDTEFKQLNTPEETSSTLISYVNYGGYNDYKEFLDSNASKIKEKFEISSLPDHKGKVENRSETPYDPEEFKTFSEGATGATLAIKPALLNAYLNNFKIIGNPVLLPITTGSTTTNMFVGLENFGFAYDTTDKCLKCYLTANLNGININGAIPLNLSIDNKTVAFNVGEGIKIGAITVKADTISTICSKFKDVSGAFTFDNGKFLVNLEKIPDLAKLNFSVSTEDGNIVLTKTA